MTDLRASSEHSQTGVPRQSVMQCTCQLVPVRGLVFVQPLEARSVLAAAERVLAAADGAVAYGEVGHRWSCDLRPDQMANASSWNAAATRRFVGSSAASS
jgi:hypothetical protein